MRQWICDKGNAWWTRPAVLVAGMGLVAGLIPLAVALGVLHQPRFYPSLDIALTELRVRDVASAQPPLVGLGGRLDAFGHGGSHPGPLSFWLLWPLYALLGGTAWSLQTATVVLNLAALGVAIWIAYRRGGLAGALGVATALAMLARAYGAERLTEPWNPYLPVLWWVVFLLAVWSVICDDLLLAPVAVFAGSLCAQTHVSYVGLVVGIGTVAALVVVLGAVVNRDDRADLRRRLAWVLGSLTFLVALWLPPLIDQAANDPGNFSTLREHFADPVEPQVGLGRTGVETWLTYLNPWTFVGRSSVALARTGSAVPGLALLTAWVAAVVVSLQRRDRAPELWRLHLTVGVAVGLGLVSISRILGLVWDYLILWSWGTTTLLVVAIGWTVAVAVTDRHPPESPGRVDRLVHAAAVGLVALLVVVSAGFTSDAASTDIPGQAESRALAAVVPDTVGALRRGNVPGGGTDGLYLVRWLEYAQGNASAAFGLVNELDRHGLRIGVQGNGTQAVHHRKIEADEATAAINLVVGGAIDDWEATPGAVRVASFEPRTPEQLARYDRLRDDVAQGLRNAGMDQLTRELEQNLFVVAISPDLPPDLQPKVTEMIELGLPLAIFVAPVDVRPTPSP